MTEAAFRGAAPSIKSALAAAVLAITGCSGLSAPTEQSIAGLSPSGSVTINEDFVAGLGGGTGTLYYQGHTYPFKLAGTVVGSPRGCRIVAQDPAREALMMVAAAELLLMH